MHCKACDAMLTAKELKRINPITKEPEDMCIICLETIGQFSTDNPYQEDIVDYGDCC